MIAQSSAVTLEQISTARFPEPHMHGGAQRRGGPLLSLLLDAGCCGHLMAFFGGMYDFGGKGSVLNAIYATVWSICFSLCASACFLNLWVCASPYHLLPSDLLVAYIHIPVWLTWRFWRRSLGSKHFAKLVSHSRLLKDSHRRTFERALRICIIVVFAMMVATSLLAVAAYALPPTIDLLDQSVHPPNGSEANTTSLANQPESRGALRSRSEASGGQTTPNRAGRCLAMQSSIYEPQGEGEEHALLSRETVRAFMAFHALSMFFVIPPIVCVVLSVYTMLILVFALHLLDWYRMWIFVDGHIHRFQTHVLERAVADGDLAFVQRPDREAGLPAIVCFDRSRESLEQMNLCTRSNVSVMHIRQFEAGPSSVPSVDPSATPAAVSVEAVKKAALLLRTKTLKSLRARRSASASSSPRRAAARPPADTSSLASSQACSASDALSVSCSRPWCSAPAPEIVRGGTARPSEQAKEAAPPGAQHGATRWSELAAVASSLEDAAAFSAMMDSINSAVDQRLVALDETCQRASLSYLHLLLVNSAQLIVVCANFEAHTIGEVKFARYTWYWPLGDAFHALVGILLLSVLLFAYAAVTESVSRVVEIADCRCAELHMAAARRSVLAGSLRSIVSGVGAHVAGVTISKEFCIMFVWAMALTIWSSLVSILQMF